MKIEALVPLPETKVPFRLSSFKSVPKDAGCYVLTTFTNDILYIGLSDNLYNRFKQHLDNTEKTAPTSEGKAIWFYFNIHSSFNLPLLERTWLNQFSDKHGRRPILNKVDSPIS
jgi:excinuclease UvrABC nuclease subunit